MPKKKLIETTGKEETFEPTNLEQILGYNQLARYNTTEASVYNLSLEEMNRVDLENEARRVGTPISLENNILKQHLLKEFNAYVSSLNKPKNLSKPIQISKEVQKILQEGR